MEQTWQQWLRMHVASVNRYLERYDALALRAIMAVAVTLSVAAVVMDLAGFNVHYRASFAGLHIWTTQTPQTAARIDLDRFAPDVPAKLPDGVTLAGGLPVIVPVAAHNFKSVILSRLQFLPADLLFLAVVWLVRRIVLSTIGSTGMRNGDPFVTANVRRLQLIGAFLILMPLVSVGCQIAASELVLESVVKDSVILPFEVDFTWLWMGALVLILSEVFAAGVRLREDVEGLV